MTDDRGRPLTVDTGLDFPAELSDDPIRIYMRDISRVRLLSARDEVELAMAIERGVEAERQIKVLTPASPDLRRRLEAEVGRGELARRRLAEANLRLVVSIARRYLHRGVPLLDLLQEGNLGLLRAVGKFDYTLGFRFSTYATWWIRQAISRAVADQARTIRLPVHMSESIGKVSGASRRLTQELGREPTHEEIGEDVGLAAERVTWILKSAQETISLEAPVGGFEDTNLGDLVEDRTSEAPSVAVDRQLLRELVADVLGTLQVRERRVLELRYGMGDGRARSLEEIGYEFGVTRERIRQIEADALRKLRHSSRSRRLKDYAE